jgi:hypothetical protein
MLNSITSTPNTSITINGLAANTTYYWSVVASNNAGQATGSPTWSFTTGPSSLNVPNEVTGPTPADMATGVPLDLTDANNDQMPDNAVTMSWTAAAGGDLPNRYLIDFSDDPANLTRLGFIRNTQVRLTDLAEDTNYYWSIVPVNNAGEAANPAVWSFDTNTTASIEEAESRGFSIYPNPVSDLLTIQTEHDIRNGAITNLSGQVIKTFTGSSLTNNQLDLSELDAGIYLLQMNTTNGAVNVKIVKQ